LTTQTFGSWAILVVFAMVHPNACIHFDLKKFIRQIELVQQFTGLCHG